MSAPVKRKLAAILAADAVGYSRMMAADEEGTMKILSAHRSVIDGIIQFHEGRIINTAGDSVLAEFASPTQAVRCAVEIQDALKTRNASLPEARQLHFRIGVNLGDVMVKGEDLLGDGVNVAARLEGIAEPGEIYLSSSVYDQIAGKLDLGFVDLGEQSLKNIDRPVRAYRVERGGGGRRKTAARRTRAPIGPWIAAGIAVAALGAGGAWYLEQRSKAQDVQAQSAADSEILKARAEAEAAKKAAAEATASADAAKRALEEQRVAEARARAQSELAAARAEAEATRRKAEKELSAAAEARRAAEAAAKTTAVPAPKPVATASAPTLRWSGLLACGGVGTSPPAAFSVLASSSGEEFQVSMGRAGQPGSMQMKGTRQPDGRLVLSGSGISGRPEARGKPYATMQDGAFSGERYEGRGKLGARDCALTLLSESAAARLAQVRAKALSGAWLATFACAGFASVPPVSYPALVAVNGDTYVLRRGRKGEPGEVSLSGVRQPDGTLRLTGSGIAGRGPARGKPFPILVEGRFTDDTFEGRGMLGKRDCALKIARR